MNEHPMLVGAGMIGVDISLGLLSLIAACIQYWRIACRPSGRLVYIGRWMIALGWSSLSARVFWQLYSSGDILISLPSLISLILVASGSIIVTLLWQSNQEPGR